MTKRDPMAGARPVVGERSGGMCERCGAARASDVHHRKLRRFGDHLAANLLHLCHACHMWVHANIAASQVAGWILHSWDDPRAVPVKHAVHGRVWLDDEGGISRRKPPGFVRLLDDGGVTA